MIQHTEGKMATFGNFLLEFYKRLIFNAMPDDQFEQYCEYVKTGDFNGNMKHWTSMLEKDALDPKKYKEVIDPRDLKGKKKLYVRAKLPDPFTDADYLLDDNEWRKMYSALSETLQTMASDKAAHPDKYIQNKQASDFLNEFFDGVLFKYTTIEDGSAADKEIKELLDLLENNPRVHGLLSADKYYGVLDKDFTFEDLINGIKSKKYNSNPTFRDRMLRVADVLVSNTQNQWSPWYGTFGKSLDFNAIRAGFESEDISNAQITALKHRYKFLLETLYEKPKAFEVFSSFDSSKISKTLNDAKEFVDYNKPDSKSYIHPKREEKLSLPEAVSKWWDDTYENYFKKFTKLRGDHIFVSMYAKLICKAIDSEKIKPTDGLDKILESADKIKKYLSTRSAKAPDHFNWLVTTLTDLKSTMPKTFAKALSHGAKMELLVSEIALKAVPTKMDEAKTAMEVLSVIRYGYTTSKIMDTFNKSDLTIFSDKDLSMNKNNPAMQFINNALDHTIKFAFQSIGYGITIAGNAYLLRNRKFNNKNNRISGAKQRLKTAVDAKKTNLENEKRALNDGLTIADAERNHKMNDYITAYGLPLTATYNDIIIDADTRISTITSDVSDSNDKLEMATEALKENIDRVISTPGHPDLGIAKSFNKSTFTLSGLTPAVISTITDTAFKTSVQDFVIANAEYSANETKLTNIQTIKRDLINATKEIDDFAALRNSVQDKIDKLNDETLTQYDELMAYWKFLISGKMNTHHGNTKTQQKANDEKTTFTDAKGNTKEMTISQAKFQKFLQDYSMTS